MFLIFSHLFLPHPSNNHKARLLQPSALLLYLFVFAASQILFSFLMFASPQVLGAVTNITLKELEELLNKRRIENALLPFKTDSLLSKAAYEKANDMFAKGYWAHYSPDGKTPWFFIEQAGYQYKYAGENLARDFALSEQVVKAWMKSPTHKKNILDPKFTDMGLAVTNGMINGEPTTLVVLFFGTPTLSSQVSALNSSSDKGKQSFISQSADRMYSSDVAGVRVFNSSRHVFDLTKQVAVLLGLFLVIILYIDAVSIFRKKIYRISGNSIAHMMLFLFLLGALFLTERGVII